MKVTWKVTCAMCNTVSNLATIPSKQFSTTCKKCGKQIVILTDQIERQVLTSEEIERQDPTTPQPKNMLQQVEVKIAPSQGNTRVSDKKWVTTLLLCLFLGGMGIHRFYVGKIGTGLLMVVTLGGMGIWTLIDFFRICTKSFKDKKGFALAA